MQSSKYLDQSIFDIWLYKNERKKHKKNLSEIANGSLCLDQSLYHRPNPRKLISYKQSQKEREIKRENESLLNRLNRISNRTCTHKSNYASPPKSLNISNRKREAQRIYMENKKFAGRLLEKHSSISFLKLKQALEDSVKLKNLRSKLPLIEKRGRVSEVINSKKNLYCSSKKLLTNKSSLIFPEESSFLEEFRNRKYDLLESMTKPLQSYKTIDLKSVNPTEEFVFPRF